MKISIVGLGLIGASLAKALKDTAQIIGVDMNRHTVQTAIDDGVISQGGTGLAEVAGSDMVIIAVPVMSIVETATGIIRYIGEGTIVTDTGSTKARIVRSIDMVWPSFVGSHPIAGKENPGYDSSQADLFRSAMTIITPSPATSSACMEKVKWLWESCGSLTSTMDPERHDELMAIISHMPHLLSYVSMSMTDKLRIQKELLGAGFRDFTRIAASDPIMWRDIFLDNKGNILPLVDRYIEDLKKVRGIIEQGRGKELEDTLFALAQIRRGLYGNSR
jgi:prephenate dehydrogenase